MSSPPRRMEAQKLNRDLLAPVLSTRWTYVVFVGVLALGVAAGISAWSYQVVTGIGETNLHPPIFWGVYIASFVFWIGVSHAGTFISGALRLSKAEWRRPVTRIAELMTLISLIVAALFIFYHLGRVWRFYYLIPYPNQRTIWPNFRSPLLWDATAIFTYSIASTIYLYLPMIPDFALLRDRVSGWRKPLYRLLSLGWQGTHRQWQIHETAIRIITPLIFMIAVSVHSIVGWDFGMALVPMWHETIMAPYFVSGAVHSGLAMVLVGMYFIRKAYRLEAYLEPFHFDKVGKVMVVTTLVWGYLYFCDKLTIWYGRTPDEMTVLMSHVIGRYAPAQWFLVGSAFLVPLLALTQPRFRRWPLGMMALGVLVNLGMYIERVLIIVPSLGQPRLHFNWSTYFPSWVEFTIMFGALCMAVLLYVLAIKVVPMLSLWEIKEARNHVPDREL